MYCNDPDASSTSAPDASANAVVCLHGARARLQAAVATLAPDGVLYLELDGGLRGRIEAVGVRRSCAALGLRVIGRYLPHPDFEEPVVYLPLEMPHAVDWYLRNVFTTSAWRARLPIRSRSIQ